MKAKTFFTSDWHVGEAQTPATPSFLRPRPTELMVRQWMIMCRERLTPQDTLVFLGDVGILLEDFDVVRHLPDCRKILVMGDKEYSSKYFDENTFREWNCTLGLLFSEIHRHLVMNIGGQDYFLAHKPSDCLGQDLPALCGHVHGIWRSAKMPNGQPIINVGIDAWGGLVSEEFVSHQYKSILKHYDNEAFPAQW